MNYLKKFKKDKDKTPDESTTRELSPEDVPNDDEKKKDAKAKDSMTDKAMTFMKPYLKQAQSWTANQASDAKLELQKAAGLGARPDVLPQGEALVVGEPRTVELGWHPVAGATGKWFAEKTIIGAKISQKIGKYPDPTQHWAVIVGDYVHQLWMDENLDIIYINEPLKREDWTLYEVGKTRFNDQALGEASRMTIHNMRAKRPAYNLISNNCQNFAVELLKAIQVGSGHEFGTTFAIYQRATGKGAIRDLFAEKPEGETAAQKQDEDGIPGPPRRQDTATIAQQIMDEKTTKLDHDGG
ncbi:hypothetical protein CLAFUW4_07388 [Fulvia fulva]|uniref:PPPDE domain-containing protein n=1 Tax=Passalora fulva TaxID=5499 RepID=A0A9Q8LKK0_PASFU|nr:uncharacterized protein CLAFUR5_07518 [Fulvia fulva]KAK4621768.1 hypothetical protein CLAFUR4_07395 [Fulvia fulva]KAK4622550.1 hypothetical protein CLAFUR0_07394 [Fulvia fulva]UJO18458.1 hypothetical protein CLAFUR5_07518 [Fulvia fulva]WPV16028.1 hypothetical protein CLAFUW4_07388 [Fulvia fulva]WPV31544.1 hypothetical protein CLAFUW7_07391 [Fulvia fulva]